MDIELENAIGRFKNDPQGLQRYLQTEQEKVFKDITSQKESTFEKVYGDLSRATDTQKAFVTNNKENKKLSELNQNLYENQQKNIDSITYDKDLASRKYEMNEWSVNNKKDTLFVFSMLFIVLSGLLLITGLWKLNMISMNVWIFLGIPMIVIFILTIVYRSQYTNIFRNKRYWNRKSFEGKYGKIHIPLVCPGALDDIQSGINSVQSNIRSGVSSAAVGAANSTQYFAQGVSNVAQNVADNAARI